MNVASSITITHVLEHLYCPRFTYYEYVLAIPERQQRRWKVMKGREVHLERQKINRAYLRKKLGVVDRQFDVPLASTQLGIRGVADEVLTLADGSMAPFDYKFAPAPKKPYHNQRVQSILYGLLIQETFDKPVRRGFICYVRSKHRVVELPIGETDFTKARQIVAEVTQVIQRGYLPPATRYRSRCADCCYRNICIQ